ncbi:MAG: hypothetical protein DA408_17015 [Bacteroidetes bacterium]|nr:MAG: hypothetical protein C7N36_06460 [Bacteroidota bacterium]PTM10065.1 MAG: hypothetical protein DA408_17015 [Bacteroidota bacterium]
MVSNSLYPIRWFRIALINLVLATSLGALLRFAFVEELTWIKFLNVLHGHSHVAMLGWIYLALFTLLTTFFQPDTTRLRAYNRLFGLTQISVLGMFVSFPLQGYGPVSIAFSTAHLLLSYAWAWRFWTDTRQQPPSWSLRFAWAAVGFMVLSTLGAWSLGPILLSGLHTTLFFHLAVQFFLHFQFNGWFLFAALALVIRLLEQQGLLLPDRQYRLFFGLLSGSCVLTYALAVAWSTPLPVVFAINGLGVTLQLAALLAFLRLLWPVRAPIMALFSGWSRWLLVIAFYSFTGKIVIQTAVVLPFIARVAYTIRNYVIGFIHLILLGAVSSLLFALALNKGILQSTRLATRLGFACFVTGLLGSELLLFFQGTLLWGSYGFLPLYYEGLFGVSVLIPLGALLVAWGGQIRWGGE